MTDYLSRYFCAACTMIEKPKKKNEPAMRAKASTTVRDLENIPNIPQTRDIAPIMLMALGTRSLCDCFSLLAISFYRSYPDLGFSSIVNGFWHKVRTFCREVIGTRRCFTA